MDITISPGVLVFFDMEEGTGGTLKIKSPFKNLLLIEKDREIRQKMKRYFELSGYQVNAVGGKGEADRVVITQNQPDIILFIANLPPPASFISGLEIHESPKFLNIPMIIISFHEHSIKTTIAPEADDFTVAYITQLSQILDLENLVNYLVEFRVKN